MSAVLDNQDMQRLLDRLGPASVAMPEAANSVPVNPVPRPARRWPMAVGMLGGGAAMGVLAAMLVTRPVPAKNDALAIAAAAASAAAPQAPRADGAVLQGSGYVVAERQATVSAEVTGRLAALHVHAGDRVRRGQLLAELDPSALDAQIAVAASELAAQQQVDRELEVQIKQAEAQRARIDSLVAVGFVSPQQGENERYKVELLVSQRDTRRRQIEVAQQQLQLQRKLAGQLRVVAPFDGIVTDSSAQVGEIVSPVSSAGGFARSGIATLVDLDSLQVEVKVNEKFIHRVQVGQAVRITLHADASVRQEGRVTAVMPAAERESGAVKVRIALSKADPRVLPNMGVDVSFMAPQASLNPQPGVSS
jgi:RND family efflux transporter MFP subunit